MHAVALTCLPSPALLFPDPLQPCTCLCTSSHSMRGSSKPALRQTACRWRSGGTVSGAVIPLPISKCAGLPAMLSCNLLSCMPCLLPSLPSLPLRYIRLLPPWVGHYNHLMRLCGQMGHVPAALSIFHWLTRGQHMGPTEVAAMYSTNLPLGTTDRQAEVVSGGTNASMQSSSNNDTSSRANGSSSSSTASGSAVGEWLSSEVPAVAPDLFTYRTVLDMLGTPAGSTSSNTTARHAQMAASILMVGPDVPTLCRNQLLVPLPWACPCAVPQGVLTVSLSFRLPLPVHAGGRRGAQSVCRQLGSQCSGC